MISGNACIILPNTANRKYILHPLGYLPSSISGRGEVHMVPLTRIVYGMHVIFISNLAAHVGGSSISIHNN